MDTPQNTFPCPCRCPVLAVAVAVALVFTLAVVLPPSLRLIPNAPRYRQSVRPARGWSAAPASPSAPKPPASPPGLPGSGRSTATRRSTQRYRRSRQRAECESVIIMCLGVPNAAVQTLREPAIRHLYWPSNDWKELVWRCRTRQALPTRLRRGSAPRRRGRLERRRGRDAGPVVDTRQRGWQRVGSRHPEQQRWRHQVVVSRRQLGGGGGHRRGSARRLA